MELVGKWMLGLACFAGSIAIQAQDYDYELEAREAFAREDVARAIALVESLDEESIDWLVKLTEIPAPPFMEQPRGEFYMFLLEEAGIDNVTMDDVGNVIARIPGRRGGKTLAVVAHLDTVFPEGTQLLVEQEGDRYCAPGVGDNGRGLVAMLVLARALVGADVNLAGDLLLVASVGEEGIGDLRGVRHLFRDGGPAIDEFIAIDGGGASRIVTTSVGSIRYRLSFRGPGGHSWGAFGLANPAHALSRAIYLFDQAAHAYVNTTGDKVTYNIGRIGGGTSVNSIPFENWAEIDMRSANPDRLAQINKILETAAERALAEQNELKTHGASLTIEMERIGFRPAGSTDENGPLVQRMSAAMRHGGVEPEYRGSSTDANVPMSLSVPAITIGGGGQSRGAHSLHECWEDKNSNVAIQNALLTIVTSLSDPAR